MRRAGRGCGGICFGWGSAYADGVGPTIRIALVFVLGHFLGTSLLVSTLMYFLVGRVLGKRRQGLFGAPGDGDEGLEFGYCFDVCSSTSGIPSDWY